jgi:hypothetical protein
VYDASGRDVAGSVGPLLEDNNLVLTCEVRGGKLAPPLINTKKKDATRENREKFCESKRKAFSIGKSKRNKRRKIQLKVFINQFELLGGMQKVASPASPVE